MATERRVFRVRQTAGDRFTLERINWAGHDSYHRLTYDEVKPLADELIESGAEVVWEMQPPPAE